MSVLTFRAWWDGDYYDIPRGFTRATEDTLHSLRIGKLCIVFGVDDS